ncbi:hypothetical protein VC83_03817 [Pseudogymnoascus destructans]|uniref:Uncharacterized protein n=1 Tax=Pseudogymnoascus destructans TaxID=655981 RepID=A0A177AEX8_9PEZI|nr:uncharacterized protein VC83_03817 [Pseudogymnoascus destructans]OAF59811.1 hypothetical protein VC83_03817 [Pseudogymnoascus destructans]
MHPSHILHPAPSIPHQTNPSPSGFLVNLGFQVVLSVSLSLSLSSFSLLFHPFSLFPIPSSLHFLGGFSPNSAYLVHTCRPLLYHLLLRSSSSSSSGRQLLFRILRIASGETSNLAASTGTVYWSGNCALMARMPARASGERRFRGAQPSENFSWRAAFWLCQGRRGGGVQSSSSFLADFLGKRVGASASSVCLERKFFRGAGESSWYEFVGASLLKGFLANLSGVSLLFVCHSGARSRYSRSIGCSALFGVSFTAPAANWSIISGVISKKAGAGAWLPSCESVAFSLSEVGVVVYAEDSPSASVDLCK